VDVNAQCPFLLYSLTRLLHDNKHNLLTNYTLIVHCHETMSRLFQKKTAQIYSIIILQLNVTQSHGF